MRQQFVPDIRSFPRLCIAARRVGCSAAALDDQSLDEAPHSQAIKSGPEVSAIGVATTVWSRFAPVTAGVTG